MRQKHCTSVDCSMGNCGSMAKPHLTEPWLRTCAVVLNPAASHPAFINPAKKCSDISGTGGFSTADAVPWVKCGVANLLSLVVTPSLPFIHPNVASYSRLHDKVSKAAELSWVRRSPSCCMDTFCLMLKMSVCGIWRGSTARASRIRPS
jgi:hypothetical protein